MLTQPLCIVEQSLASSMLENQFGDLQMEILLQNEFNRVVRITDARNHSGLEIASVVFEENAQDLYPAVHKKIINGALMGKTFREAGVRFQRRVVAQGSLILPKQLSSLLAGSGRSCVKELEVFVGAEQSRYASILEIYAPVVEMRISLYQSRDIEINLEVLAGKLGSVRS